MNAFPICDFHDLVRELETAGVENVVCSKEAQNLTFLFRACCCDNFGANVFCNLQCSKANTASSTMNENPLIFFEFSKVDERIVSCQEGNWIGCG